MELRDLAFLACRLTALFWGLRALQLLPLLWRWSAQPRVAGSILWAELIVPALWALAAAMYLFTMFGVTLGNHRHWTIAGSRPGSGCRWCWPWRAACRWKATSSNG